MASFSPSGLTPTLDSYEIIAGQRQTRVLELADDVPRFLNDNPILALRERPWRRAGKWTKRRPALAGLTAVIGVAVAVLIIVQLHRALASETTYEQACFNERVDQLKQAHAAFDQFTQYRGDAVFHWSFATVLASGDAPSNLAEIRKAANKALALVDLCGDARTAPCVSPYWSRCEKAEVLAGSCRAASDAC